VVRAVSSKTKDTRSSQSDDEMLKNLHYVKDLGYRSKAALERGEASFVRRIDARALGRTRSVVPGE